MSRTILAANNQSSWESEIDKITFMRKSGLSWAKIANQYGVTRQRIHQVFAKFDDPKKHKLVYCQNCFDRFYQTKDRKHYCSGQCQVEAEAVEEEAAKFDSLYVTPWEIQKNHGIDSSVVMNACNTGLVPFTLDRGKVEILKRDADAYIKSTQNFRYEKRKRPSIKERRAMVAHLDNEAIIYLDDDGRAYLAINTYDEFAAHAVNRMYANGAIYDDGKGHCVFGEGTTVRYMMHHYRRHFQSSKMKAFAEYVRRPSEENREALRPFVLGFNNLASVGNA